MINRLNLAISRSNSSAGRGRRTSAAKCCASIALIEDRSWVRSWRDLCSFSFEDAVRFNCAAEECCWDHEKISEWAGIGARGLGLPSASISCSVGECFSMIRREDRVLPFVGVAERSRELELAMALAFVVSAQDHAEVLAGFRLVGDLEPTEGDRGAEEDWPPVLPNATNSYTAGKT
mmetsp:Transcript_28968/g.52501  ORF Transcript_28968/g.52501 Transcript_28968/m.52501 type:complete len:177 (-) Transcript_28968:387-917(-)|eukprot:CAMPEP_0197675956 /NCGR_PEP_ID=MMETSP1338-20131121/85895_1 /TAXON_ID=43686 ORGANISM="Pelagodinium beii, Strain RCC1491" /NCGR_SAMPLE_ID=MMETSP1338 /ASSEMBLY_ACC=CAM_ASM_000754 /LENGTH=176 /DNA_ID=CAMNT_0043256565 /DNA_START=115 /DNA_END=645 /DNA_ORIENTATION=-